MFPTAVCSCCGKPPFVEGENYVVTDDGCWEWIGPKDGSGYGRLTYRHIRFPAHRLSYILATGEDPGAKPVHHTCENKPCVNPDHLEAVDPVAHFNGHRKPEWYEKRKSPPTPDVVAEIRERHEAGQTNKKIAEAVGRKRQYVSKVIRNQMWAEGAAPKRGRSWKLPVEARQEIRERYAAGGITQTQLAKEYGITQVYVSRITLGKA